MDWKGREKSSNVEDRRGSAGKKLALGGVGTLVIVVIGLFLGVDPSTLLEMTQATQPSQTSGSAEPGDADPEEEQLADFLSVVLRDTEFTWEARFRERGMQYSEPTLVLFRDRVSSACGVQSSAVGPFYCPADRKAYIDLSFYDQLERRFGAPGDFAQAYVLAHEVGHHVQNLLGTSSQVRARQRNLSEVEANKLSVRLELQADCYAGVWAHHAEGSRDLLERGDIDEGLRAASAIGDDTLQRRATGRVQPESFTHGSSAQRQQWFSRGMKEGTIEACDTFEQSL